MNILEYAITKNLVGGSSGGSEMEEQFIRLIEGDPANPVTKLPIGLTKISGCALQNCLNLVTVSIPTNVKVVGSFSFMGCTQLTEVTFEGKPKGVFKTAFDGCSNLRIINVPWAEGEVSNAPWGATNAIINYNYAKEPDSVVPIHPLNSKSYTNTYYGFTASASDGNHVSVEKTTVYDTPVNINLYDMSTNVDVFSNNNHIHETIFSLKAGDKVLTKKINTAIATENADFSASNHTIFFRTGDGGSTSLNCYSDCAVGLDVENEITMTSDFDVGSIGFYLSGNARTAIYKLDFDLEIYVNGVRYV